MYFSIPLSSHNKAITDVAISRRWSHPIVSLSRHDIKTNFGSHVIKMGVSARCETGGCGSSPSLDPRLAGILVRIVATRQRPFAPDSFLHCVRITQYPPPPWLQILCNNRQCGSNNMAPCYFVAYSIYIDKQYIINMLDYYSFPCKAKTTIRAFTVTWHHCLAYSWHWRLKRGV